VRVAVVGHGKMGHEVEAVLRERDHEPVVVLRDQTFPRDCQAGIDFTRAESVVSNVQAALSTGTRYVVGTTGWSDHEAEIRALVESNKGGFVHGANFSLGVGLFYEIVRHAAGLMAPFPEYDPYVVEKHHRAKRDAPSGTAKELARILAAGGGVRTKPVFHFEGPLPDRTFHVSAVRAGGIVGEHTVGFDSGGDEILLEHRARSRRGFALGAVLAAEWVSTRTGFYAFSEVIRSLLAQSHRPHRIP
jgi:4-hydroxy-tetrahydrodipicolinate reductase